MHDKTHLNNKGKERLPVKLMVKGIHSAKDLKIISFYTEEEMEGVSRGTCIDRTLSQTVLISPTRLDWEDTNHIAYKSMHFVQIRFHCSFNT